MMTEMATVSSFISHPANPAVPLCINTGKVMIEAMPGVADQPACRALLERFGDAVAKVKHVSERIFPGAVSVELALDPEDSNHAFFIFDVDADSEYAQYRDRIFAWHDEVDRIVPDRQTAFSLIVHPRHDRP
jgi:hypothetical protein